MNMGENRRGDKIKEIEKYIEELEPNLPNTLEEYKRDFKIRAICERYFEKIVEAVVDLAFIFIKEQKLKLPENDESSFYILRDAGIIDATLSKKLKDAKGMRNIIAHEYGKINDELVFEAITEQLINDVKEFISEIKKKS